MRISFDRALEFVAKTRWKGIGDLHPREKGFQTKLGRARTEDGREIPPCRKEEIERHYGQYRSLRDWTDVLGPKKTARQGEAVTIVRESNTCPSATKRNSLPGEVREGECVRDGEDPDRKRAPPFRALTPRRGMSLNDAVLGCHEGFWRDFGSCRQIAR